MSKKNKLDIFKVLYIGNIKENDINNLFLPVCKTLMDNGKVSVIVDENYMRLNLNKIDYCIYKLHGHGYKEGDFLFVFDLMGRNTFISITITNNYKSSFQFEISDCFLFDGNLDDVFDK